MADKQIKYEIDVELKRDSFEKIKKSLLELNKTLTGDINKTSPIRDMYNLLDKSWNKKLDQLDLSKIYGEINKSEQSLLDFKKSLESMGPAGAQAYNDFSRAVLNTNLHLSEGSKLLDNMADTMAKTVKWGIASRIMNNMVGSIEKAWSYSVKLDSSLNDIRIVTGKSADEMERFAVTANRAAKALGASTRDYTEASLIYYQQGLTDEEAQRRAEITLKAANVTGQSAQEVSEQLTAVWNGYNVALGETEEYVDKLAAVAASTAADLEELSTGMSKVASAAATMGVDIDQLNAQMATIISVTRQAPESVGTALRTIYARMGDIEAGLDEETTLGNYTSKMAQLGVNVLDASGKLRDMGDVVEEIGNKWTDLTREQQVALAQTMAGTRQYNNLLTLFNNWDMYTEALETSANAAGTLQKQQDIYMESTEAHLQQMRTEAEKTYDILFDTKTVNSFIDSFTGLNSVFNTFLKSLGGGMNDFVYFGSLLTNIFNKQIAGGIENSIQKLRLFNDNKKTIEFFENIVKEGKAGYKDENGQMVYDITEAEAADFERASQLLKLQRSIKNEDFNRLNTLRQQIFAYDEILEKRALEDGIGSDITKKLANELASLTSKRELITDITQKELLNTETAKERIAILLENKASELQKVQLKTLNEKLNRGEVLTEEEIQNLLKIQEEIKTKLLHLEEQKSKALEISKEHEEDETAAIQYQRDALQKEYEDETKIKFEAQEIGDVVRGISIATQLWVSGTGIVKTLFDDTLTAGEKLSQTLTSLGAMATTVAFNWNSLKDFIPMLTTFLTSPTTLMVAGIVAAVAALVALGNEIDLLLNRERVLNKELEQNKKAVEESKQAYEDLKNTVSNYKNAIDSIKDLTEGTIEFYEAVLKSNDEAKKLIETLGLVAGSQYQIDKNGLIQIDEEAIKQGLYEESQKWYKAQLTQSLTEYSIRERQKEQELTGLSRNLQHEVNEKTPGNYGISYEQARSIIDNVYSENEQVSMSIGELEETTNKNLSEFQNKIGTFNQQELAKIDDFNGSMSVLITEEMADVIATIKQKQAEDNAIYQQIGNEAIAAYATRDQMTILETLPSLVNKTLDTQIGKEITARKDEREAAGLGGRNVTGPLEQAIGLTAQAPDWLANVVLGPIWNFIGDKIVEEQKNYTETQAQNQKTIEEHLEEWTNTFQEYINAAEEAGFDRNAGGQYIASAQFEAKQTGDVSSETLNLMTIPELQFALENSEEMQQVLLKTNETIDEYIEKVKAAQGPLDEWDRNQARISADLEAYNATLEDAAEQLDTTSAAMQLYADAVNNAGQSNQRLDASTAEQIKALAKFNKAYNKAIKLYETNKDAVEDYANSVKKKLVPSFESAEKAGEVLEQLNKMGLKFNGTQLADNIDTINTLLNGTQEEAEKAYRELEKISIENTLNNTFQSTLHNFDSYRENIDGLVNYLSNIQIDPSGITTLDQEWSNKLINMVNNAHLSMDQVKTLFENLHIEMPEIDTSNMPKAKEEMVHVRGYTTHHRYKGQVPVLDPAGLKKPTYETVNYEWDETMDDYEYPYVQLTKDQSLKYIDVGGHGGSGGGGFSRAPSNSSGGGKSGGGSSKKPNTIDPVEKEKDRYHDVNVQLKLIQNELDKLGKQKDKLFGDDLIENLNQQLELLNDQIDTTNEKMKIAEGEAQELQGKLAASGVTFNADGTIGNYAQAYQAQLNYVNSIINQYNSMGAEAQEGFKDTVEAAKENFEKFVNNINRYDEVITDLIPGLAADVQEAIDKQIDIKIEEFDMEIELRLDLAEAERDWNNFKKKIIDGIEDDDILGNAMARLVDFSSYYKEDETGAAQALRKQIDNTLKELYQMDETGSSNVYGDNRTAALEDLKKYYDELMSQMEDILKLQEEIHQSYIDMMNEAQDKFDEQIKAYGIVNDLIEHDAKVISLVYGEEAYHQLSNFYDKQQANFKAEMDFQRQQVEFWKDQMDAVEAGTEAWDEAKEKWTAAAEELNDIIENSIENLQDKYLNAINAIFQDLNNKVTSGAGLGYIEEEWNLINKNADQYLDNINRLYGIQNLENKYLDAINDTNNIAAQKQLKKIMDEEIKNLQERDRLTEYDIERANKKYEITLKQIALEEAQQNKTQLRLRRDTQGNYRYEFISDIDQVNQLQNDLDDLYNSLYNFDKENYADNLNQLYDVWNEFQEKMAEAAQINDPQARAEKELLIQEQYGELINGLVEQNETIRGNLYDSAFEDLARLYDEDKNNFLEMTQAEQDAIMNDLIPYWDAGVQHMADVFAGEGGFVPTCEEAIDELHEATKEYEDGLKELEDTANISFDDIGNGIDDVINQTQELLANNDELINSYREEMDAIGGVVNELDNLVNKYQESADAAKAAEKAAYDYWSEQQRQAAEAAARDQAEKAKKAAEEAAKKAAQTPKPTPAPAPIPAAPNGGDGVPRVGDVVDYISGIYHADSYGGGASGSMNLGGKVQITIVKDDGRPYPIHIATLGGGPLGWLAKHQISGYDTGGYTGEWNNNGRLALLHQKELVLNQQDTRNLLNAVNVMRSITSAVGSRVLERLSMASSNGAFNGGNSGILDQNVHIEANFPNATNHAEIEEALNNLVNAAAQRAQTKER